MTVSFRVLYVHRNQCLLGTGGGGQGMRAQAPSLFTQLLSSENDC